MKRRISQKKTKRKRSKHIRVFFAVFLVGLMTALAALTIKRPQPLSLRNNFSSLTQNLAIHTSIAPSPTKALAFSIAKADAAMANLGYCVMAPILFYHHVEPMSTAIKAGHQQFTVDNSVFDQQLLYLKSAGYKTASVDEVVQAIRTHRAFPAKTLALTFDDGYEDAYTYVLPLLKKYGFKGNFMFATGLLSNKGYISWAQAKEIANSEGMFVYNHTVSHAALGNISKEEVTREVLEAKKDIQEKLGKESTIFVYPYGSFSPEAITILQQQGYIAALSTLPGMQQCEGIIMYLRRTRVGNAPLSLYGL